MPCQRLTSLNSELRYCINFKIYDRQRLCLFHAFYFTSLMSAKNSYLDADTKAAEQFLCEVVCAGMRNINNIVATLSNQILASLTLPLCQQLVAMLSCYFRMIKIQQVI